MPESQNTRDQGENIPNSHMIRTPGDQGTRRELRLFSSKVTKYHKCLNILDGVADMCFGLKGGVTIAAKRATELLRLLKRNLFHPKTCLYHLGGDGVFGNLDCVFGFLGGKFGIWGEQRSCFGCKKETCFTPKLVFIIWVEKILRGTYLYLHA